MENPLLTSKSRMVYDQDCGQIELTNENYWKYFNDVYVLVKINNDPIPSSFYSWTIPEDDWTETKSKLTIKQVSTKILKNHWSSFVLLSKDILEQFNHSKYNLTEQNIVIPILNISLENLEPYLQQFKPIYTLEKLFKLGTINDYFKVDENNSAIIEFYKEFINSLTESKYWTHSYNCQLNKTDKFAKSEFKVNVNKLTDKTVQKVVKEFEAIQKTYNFEKPEKVINEIKTTAKLFTYSNQYRIDKPSVFTCDDILQLYKKFSFSEKLQFYLLCNLIASKKYCHLVMNNKILLNEAKPLMNKYVQLFRYLIGYAWTRFYTEETMKKTFITKDDEFIFDIDTASNLPYYPFSNFEPKLNPYMPIMVNDKELKPSENLIGISSKNSIYGLSKLEDFKRKFNIFCTGNSTNDLFKDFDWAKNKCAVSGGIMAACMSNYNPLFTRIKGSIGSDEHFKQFLNEYYGNSDIDIMVLTSDWKEFMTNVRELYNTLVVNVCSYNVPYAEPKHIQLNLTKKEVVFISENFIVDKLGKTIEWAEQNQTELLTLIESNLIKLKQIKENDLFSKYSSEEFLAIKRKFADWFDTKANQELYIIKKNEIKNPFTVNLVYSYKYTISAPYLEHKLEIFPVKYNDFFGTVSKFHLPCVRAYYDGNNVYMTPSCVSAHMTFMNIDYKYFAGCRDPIEIINKYRMRGFGTWLSAKEKQQFINYSSNVEFWQNLYSIKENENVTIICNQLFGPISLNHKLFRPRLYNMDYYNDATYVDTTNRYNDDNPGIFINSDYNIGLIDLYNNYELKIFNLVDWNRLSTINYMGSVQPLNKLLIDMMWSMSHQPKKVEQVMSNKINIVKKSSNLNNLNKSIVIAQQIPILPINNVD
jgi:hypothetical protein